MRILFVSPRSAWVRYNLLATLRAMGHDVVAWDWGSGWPKENTDRDWDAWRERVGHTLNETARREHGRRPFALIFCYLNSTVVSPGSVQELRTLGIPVVNFSCNNVPQFDLVREIAPSFDLCIVPERAALPAYQAIGARTIHLGLAANSAVYRPYGNAPEFDVTFVGQRYADRAEHVIYLMKHGIDVRVWGAGWRSGLELRGGLAAVLSVLEDEGTAAMVGAARDRLRRLFAQRSPDRSNGAEESKAEDDELRAITGHRLLHHEMVRLFSRSRISLGFATSCDTPVGSQRLTHVRLRDFEGPMSGAFYITEQQDELGEYFELGREVETYTGPEELLNKVIFYLAEPARAAAVRQAGLARARNDHTWERRFGVLFQTLGLQPARA